MRQENDSISVSRLLCEIPLQAFEVTPQHTQGPLGYKL